MSTPEEGGATANTAISSYGGGGTGGKLRNKLFRRQTTPYDRPPAALRVNSTNSDNINSWLPKMVVERASKLISYGAERFLPSVLRRRLPPPPPLQPPEMEIAQESERNQGEGLSSQEGEQEPTNGQCRQPVNSSSSDGFAELEHLLKQKTFTRSEIAHLTEILQSQAAEVSPGDASKKNVDAGRHEGFASCVYRNDGISSSLMYTPIQNSKVLESDIASPAELAKAYMGSRPSQVSPSGLGMRIQLGMEHTGLLANTLTAPKSPIVSLPKRTTISLSAAQNGFITPRSRGRSAIYNMACTPYSRVHPNPTLKRSGISGGDYAGPSTPSASLSPMENNDNFDSRSVTLKHRSSVLDDEVGSVGPMRRIRQKPNFLTPKLRNSSYAVGIGSHAKPKPQLNGDEKIKVLKHIGENDNVCPPSTSYAGVPSRSSEVAAKILQQLEKFSPTEKSSESKIGAVQEKLPSNSMSSRLPEHTLHSMGDVGSSKFLLSVPDDYKFGNKTNGTLLDVNGSSPQKPGKAEDNDPNASNIPSGRWSPVLNNDSAVTLKSSAPVNGTSVVKNGASQPQKKKAFSMSAKEDSFPAEEFKTTIQSEDKSFSGIVSRSAREHSPGAGAFGQETNVIDVPASEGTIVPVFGQGTNVTALSVPVFDKPKERNSPCLFSLASKDADKPLLLSTPSVRRAESEPELEPVPEKSSSLANISTSVGSEVATPNSDKGFQLKPVNAADKNGKCDDVSSANFSRCTPVSFPVPSFSDMNRISAGSAPLFTSSTSITTFVPTGSSTSTAAPFSGSNFGLAAKSSSSVGPVPKFAFSADLSTSDSAAPTASFSERADQIAQIDVNPISSSSTSSAAASSGNGIFKFGSSLSNPAGNISLFASATKSPVPGVDTISQGKAVASVLSASVPALNMHSSGSLGSLPTPSISFGYIPPSSSDSTSLAPSGVPVSSSFKFGATPTAGSEGSVSSFSASATPSTFKFGFSSSSPSTNTVGSGNGPAAPVFSFGGSSISASTMNTVSTFSSGTTSAFGFSSSSPSTNTVGSSNGPAAPVISFGGSSVSASAMNTVSTFSGGTTGAFGFGGSSSAFTSTSNSLGSSSAPSNAFGSGWQSLKSPVFGLTSTSASPATGFSLSASTNTEAPVAFNSSKGASSGPVFSFSSVSASTFSSPSLPNTQPIFGNPPSGGGGFVASPGNTDQMNLEDSMAEDPVPSSDTNSLFGQPSVSPTFTFGSGFPSENTPFMFNGQQNQGPPQNLSPFQASGSLEFNAGGSFSLGRSEGDKSGRKIVKVSRNKNRKR